MSSSSFTIKYDVGKTTNVAKQQPYKTKIAFENITKWKVIDKLNELKVMSFSVPNDILERTNIVLERNIKIPLITPISGIITSKTLKTKIIQVEVQENAWHFTRRIYRKGTLNNSEHDTDNHLEMQAGAESYVAGKFAKAFNFAGNNELKVLVANESNFDFEKNTAWSMGGWIKSSTTGATQFLYAKKNGNAGIGIYFDSSNHLYISLSTTPTSDELKKHYATSLLDGEWHHIWITKSTATNTGSLKLYVDGTEVTLVTDVDNLSGSIVNNNVFTLGGNSGANRYTGLMDEWRIYNVEHSSTETKEVMNNTDALSGILARYQFNTAKFAYTSTAINTIAQNILDKANEDMPTGMTWTLGPNTSTDSVDVEFKYRNHWEALQKLAKAAKLDLWVNSEEHIVYLEPFRSKGKTLDRKIDMIIDSAPTTSIDDVANQVNILGKSTSSTRQLESISETETDLKYIYEMVVSDRQLGTMSELTGVADKLLEEFKVLTPIVKGSIPYEQYVKYDMETGDVLRIVKPEQELSGQFRIMELVITPVIVQITLESIDSGISHVRSRSMGDIIAHLLRKMKDENIV